MRKTFLAGGVYMCEPDQLQAVREEISLNAAKFKKIINDKVFKKNFTLEGEKLKNVPRGFDKEDPMAEYLKHKSLVMMHYPEERDVLSPGFSRYCINIFKTMVPFNASMQRPIANP